ncbi:MAG: cytochrome c-type biogenesis protein [Alphaproteobacteria bacterium]
MKTKISSIPVVVLSLMLLFVLSAFTPLSDPALEARAIALEKTLRCPVCQGEPLSESQSQMAQAMRTFIRESLKNGKDETEVRTLLENRYGTDLSLVPPLKTQTAVLWAGPFFILLPGAWWLGRFWRGKKV